MTIEEFRAAALKVPGAVEAAHMDHPDFRVKGKIFASLDYPDEDWGMVKLTPTQQRMFMKEAPEMFSPCAGAWGKAGSTSVHLAAAKKRILGRALRAAAQNIAKKS
ncbi:MAG: MmcQ/YjbR family DNA-binding protein [Verrucomicrobiota bacterium]